MKSELFTIKLFIIKRRFKYQRSFINLSGKNVFQILILMNFVIPRIKSEPEIIEKLKSKNISDF